MAVILLFFGYSGTQYKNQDKERISHLGLISKVIPLELFLDMLHSSSKDVTRRYIRASSCQT